MSSTEIACNLLTYLILTSKLPGKELKLVYSSDKSYNKTNSLTRLVVYTSAWQHFWTYVTRIVFNCKLLINKCVFINENCGR